jgi:hypothetical protein
MKRIFLIWARSMSQVCAPSFYTAVRKAVIKAAVCIGISLAIFVLGAVISCISIPYVSRFFYIVLSLRPPSVAMLFSPFYAPFLVQAMETSTQKREFRLTSLWWSLAVYGAIAVASLGLYWIYAEGSLEALIVLIVVLAALAPFFMVTLMALPIAGVAVLFPPFKNAPLKKVWKHSQKMTWSELPFITCLLVGMMPLSLALYELLGACVRYQYMSIYGAGIIIHGFTLICWQIGWLAFMIFYQQRKHLYL